MTSFLKMLNLKKRVCNANERKSISMKRELHTLAPFRKPRLEENNLTTLFISKLIYM